MKEVEKIAQRLYNNKEKMELGEFLVLTELQRIDLLIVLKNYEENKDLKRDIFLNKYFNFNKNMRRYVGNVGAWDGMDKQWFKYIDRVKEFDYLYPELNKKEKEKEKEVNIDLETNVNIEVKEFIEAYVKEVLNNNIDRDDLIIKYKKMKQLESFKDKENLTKLISAKLPEEVLEIMSYFKKEYGFKKQDIITLALLDFQKKYGRSS